MSAFVLPSLDQHTIDELRKRIPDMSEIDLPDLQKVGKDVGKSADEAIDRLLGRSRMPVWPWVAAGIGLVAVVGAFAAWFTWLRKPTALEPMADEAMDDGVQPWQGTPAPDAELLMDLTDEVSIDRSAGEPTTPLA